MPTLFISYKRQTTVVAPLMERLRTAHYRLWFDRDEIHLGDSDWTARIDQGLKVSDGMILCLTPAACESKPVQYEVEKMRELGKPIFPIILEALSNLQAGLEQVGLSANQHIEDFTVVEQWDTNLHKLLKDLVAQGLGVTRHDLRRERNPDNSSYTLHQRYLKRLVGQIGTISLANINPDQKEGIHLEDVYIDSPTNMGISIEMKDWQVVDWFLGVDLGMMHPDPESELEFDRDSIKNAKRLYPVDYGMETGSLNALVGTLDDRITEYRKKYPKARPDIKTRSHDPWRNGIYDDILPLHLQDLVAACPRLVILGAPGSGKSTFVKYLALCLAGRQIDGWNRKTELPQWAHGDLTPIYITLRHLVASAYFPKTGHPTVDHLWRYIEAEILGSELADYIPELHYDLEHGHALLILDGLDEVPYPEGKLKERQNQLIHLCQSINDTYPQSRVVVASRLYAYAGWTLPGFQAVTITAFKDKHRIRLAQKLYRVIGKSPDEAKAMAEKLNKVLKDIDPELKDRPLFMTLMAILFQEGGQLPNRRGTLYRESILLLLDRWTQSKPNAPSLREILGEKTIEGLYACLAALAYSVHHDFGDQPGTPEINETIIFRHLKPMGKYTALDLITYLSENAGILVSPGQDEEREVFHFAHRTFQEYLTAEHLVTLCLEKDSFKPIAELITTKPQLWREVCQLAGDVLADTGRQSDLWALVGELIENDPPDDPDNPEWWRGWLAAQIIEKQHLHQQKNLNRRTEQPIRDGMVEWSVAVFSSPNPQPLSPSQWGKGSPASSEASVGTRRAASVGSRGEDKGITIIERAHIGRTLGLLGDPRPGVGLRPDGHPDIDWVEISGGEFLYGENKQPLDLPTFWMARYPVTYTQFQAFLDVPDGWHNPEWWAGLAADDNDKTPRKQFFHYGNHPRENVSWYAAMAFCRWLSAKLEQTITLPTEQQWEKAARGTDGRIYPWGDEFEETYLNYWETILGMTSAVGLFPRGQSPYGISDMAGNVWEWCLTEYSTGQSEDISNRNKRVFRGGSWYDNPYAAHADARGRNTPSNRGFNLGFRVCRLGD